LGKQEAAIRNSILILTFLFLIVYPISAYEFVGGFDPSSVTDWSKTIPNRLYDGRTIEIIEGNAFYDDNVIIGYVIYIPGFPSDEVNASIEITQLGGGTISGYWNVTYTANIGAGVYNDINIGTAAYHRGRDLRVSDLFVSGVYGYGIDMNTTGILWRVGGIAPVLFERVTDTQASLFSGYFTEEQLIKSIKISTKQNVRIQVRELWMSKEEFRNYPANLVVVPENQPISPDLMTVSLKDIQTISRYAGILLVSIFGFEVLLMKNWTWILVLSELVILVTSLMASNGNVFKFPEKFWRGNKKLFDFAFWGVEQLEKHYIFFIAVALVSAFGWFLSAFKILK
jgi:nitrate reductase NapE component